MNDLQRRGFFLACVDVLGAGDYIPRNSASLCSFTTFDRLEQDAGYWVRGLPGKEDVGDTYIKDGGVWGQPFLFNSLAHVIIPKRFYWETGEGNDFRCGSREQNIELLSKRLDEDGIEHRITDLVLEIKLY